MLFPCKIIACLLLLLPLSTSCFRNMKQVIYLYHTDEKTTRETWLNRNTEETGFQGQIVEGIECPMSPESHTSLKAINIYLS